MIPSNRDTRMTSAEALDVLRLRSLQGAVRDEIERQILDGEVAPGSGLREAALARRLGVSRGPVREALRALEEKGLVTVVKHCGAFVRRIGPDEADEIYDVRVVLEAAIGERVVRAIDRDGLAALRGLVDAMGAAVAARDVGRYAALNLAFHDALARFTGNARLHETYARLVAELALLRRHAHAHRHGALDRSYAEHRAVVEAIAAGRGDETARRLVEHATRSRERLADALASAPIPEAGGAGREPQRSTR
jgi:DNA-binding GntR family transcriptional regulator